MILLIGEQHSDESMNNWLLRTDMNNGIWDVQCWFNDADVIRKKIE